MKKNLVSNNSFDLLNSISIIITSMEKSLKKEMNSLLPTIDCCIFVNGFVHG